MSSTSTSAAHGTSRPFYFDNFGHDFLFSTAPDESGTRVYVRERDSGLFVKEWRNVPDADVDGLKAQLARGRPIVYLYDLQDMHVLEYAEQYIAHHGAAPAYRTIAANMRLAYTEVCRSMERLEAKGFIARSYLNTRGFKILRFRRSA
jgi:hypothetical protein